VRLAGFVDLSTRRLRVIRELVFEHLLRVPLSLEELAGNILVKLGVEVGVESILLGSAMIYYIILHLYGGVHALQQGFGRLVKHCLTRKWPNRAVSVLKTFITLDSGLPRSSCNIHYVCPGYISDLI